MEEAGSLDHGAGVQIDVGDAAAGCNGKNLCKPQNISFFTLQRKKAFLYERRGYHMVGPAGLIANRNGGKCDGKFMRRRENATL